MPVETFQPEDRLRKRSEFRLAQSEGRRIHTAHFLILVLPKPGQGQTRLGITVTKKVSSSAVGRNRVKRVVREVFRRNRELFPASCDVVLIARRGAPELGYAEVLDEVAPVSRVMQRKAER